MKQTMWLVVYKDHRNAPIRYFGPFSSETKADFFLASLPSPWTEHHGYVRVVTLQPFASFEGHTVAQLIKRERQNGPSPAPRTED